MDMRRLDAQNVQNCLYEWNKYERARLGEGKPKQRLRGRTRRRCLEHGRPKRRLPATTATRPDNNGKPPVISWGHTPIGTEHMHAVEFCVGTEVIERLVSNYPVGDIERDTKRLKTLAAMRYGRPVETRMRAATRAEVAEWAKRADERMSDPANAKEGDDALGEVEREPFATIMKGG